MKKQIVFIFFLTILGCSKTFTSAAASKPSANQKVSIDINDLPMHLSQMTPEQATKIISITAPLVQRLTEIRSRKCGTSDGGACSSDETQGTFQLLALNFMVDAYNTHQQVLQATVKLIKEKEKLEIENNVLKDLLRPNAPNKSDK